MGLLVCVCVCVLACISLCVCASVWLSKSSNKLAEHCSARLAQPLAGTQEFICALPRLGANGWRWFKTSFTVDLYFQSRSHCSAVRRVEVKTKEWQLMLVWRAISSPSEPTTHAKYIQMSDRHASPYIHTCMYVYMCKRASLLSRCTTLSKGWYSHYKHTCTHTCVLVCVGFYWQRWQRCRRQRWRQRPNNKMNIQQ